MASNRNINFLVLKILSPLLIISGAIGYFIPLQYKFICTDPYYNLFHIDAGIIGIIILLLGNAGLARIFNILLGSLYVYQSVASFFHLFPANLFHYTITDDIINIDIGAILMLIGILASSAIRNREDS